jgi:hypothetical protein
MAVVDPVDSGEKTVYSTAPIADSLDANDVTVTGDLADADIAVVTDLDDDVSAFVERGNPRSSFPTPTPG